ncbi:hypothetical protein J1N10_13830 [Carboxylicivirga sp. A043]|uniref:hypothetical protein n=1 Tax=Carboxylicivirga litoralis TaxID=2816963 RepID=UPI0021CAE5B8|nr:hypothetical protein [Carboxylicivirga sp. A043]MCU4157065.1 hypothetical protein [Carboxylicivirga sp. A043]
MGKLKYLIMTGGLLILTGIVLKALSVEGPWAAISFSIGGTLKLLYMIIGVGSGKVKVGAEIVLLIIGLGLVFIAIYLKKTEQLMNLYVWFLSSGLIIKALFVTLFILKQKRYRKELAVE